MLKERIKLIKELKIANDEASKIKGELTKLGNKAITLQDRIQGLIERVDNLDLIVKEEEGE